MFRQKIGQVTNCSCRLIPDGKSEYMIFKPPNQTSKPIAKQQKQKFSLKTQTTSSSKHQTKVTSAQKTNLRTPKLIQDEKISISGNIDSKRYIIQKNSVCSPQNSNVRRLQQNVYFMDNPIQEQINFAKNKNPIKTAEANRSKQQKKVIRNSDNQVPFDNQLKKDISVSNFQNQSNPHSRNANINTLQSSKKGNNFEEYYRFVSNPYSMGQRNKQNFNSSDQMNIGIVPKYRIDQRLKKPLSSYKTEIALKQFNNKSGLQQYRNTNHCQQSRKEKPLQQLKSPSNLQQIRRKRPFQQVRTEMPQIIHQSLQKLENGRQKQSRGTCNGVLTTKNSLNSDKESLRTSNNQISLISSKISNLMQNPSLQFQKTFETAQMQSLSNNKSQIYSYRGLNTLRLSGNQFQTKFLTQTSLIQNDNQIHPLNNQFSQQILQRKSRTTQNSQVYNIKRPGMQKLQAMAQKKQKLSDVFHKNKLNDRPHLIQRLNSFNDMMKSRVQCESLLDESEDNQNDESVVIMRYKDLVQEMAFKQKNQLFMIKPLVELMGKQNIGQEKNSISMMSESSKFQTNVKQNGFNINFGQANESHISGNNNLKRTVKVTKQYLTKNFNTVE